MIDNKKFAIYILLGDGFASKTFIWLNDFVANFPTNAIKIYDFMIKAGAVLIVVFIFLGLCLGIIQVSRTIVHILNKGF